MNDTAVFVACSKSKRDRKQPVWKLYDSTLFEKSWTAAQLLGDPWVISAKHDLVPATRRVEPYDETLKTKTEPEKTSWADGIWSMCPDHYTYVVVLGGRDYVEPLQETLHGPFTSPDVELLDPYEQTTGNGQQMAVAGELAWNAVEYPTPVAVERAVSEALD